MCKVLNVRQVGKRSMPDRVYVGRPSKWPTFRDRARRLARRGGRKYRAWMVQQPALKAAPHEPHCKDLVCARALPRRRADRTRKSGNFQSRRNLNAAVRDPALASFLTCRPLVSTRTRSITPALLSLGCLACRRGSNCRGR